MEFAIGFISGIAVISIVGWLCLHGEWENRRKLERRVNQLYRHFACGKGVLGCNGGPNCHWDHK